MTPAAIGIDFGTTNSVVALAGSDGSVMTRSFATKQGAVDAYRSALMFWREGRPPETRITHVSGPDALDMALGMTTEHRFLQSLKTHLSSRAFQETRLFGKLFRLEDLIGVFLSDLATGLPGHDALPLVSGRPVVFAGERPDEELAVGRLKASYGKAGMEQVDFAYEPLGAAYWYARDLKTPQTMLVADFGGGTSDFSVMRFEPGRNRGLEAIPLSHAGVGVAGDTFDYRIIEHAVSPALGKGTDYRSFGKLLPVPAHYHAAFAQWHKLSLMKSREIMAELNALIREAVEPGKLEDLLTVIEYDLGYELYRAVSAAKVALSDREETTLSFNQMGVTIEKPIRRADFDRWIADDVGAIEAALDRALAEAGLGGGDRIEAVFMTGGTSYVPAVRGLFDRRFGAGKVHIGDAFRSVASGLALLALDRARASVAA
ncbi:MAG: Hsp70 family protein [Bosea sp.]|uniref:Hsp70 family protein n=1 Tax=Bosea sp. (in: a-proteobacteria) TaxID=1871050 RepID=UPI001AC6E296|nr:Hsp70 family protein [Bosea sp. (in: a-proteobacteria)]MBN9453818.1 Hsp70 family protein [Bosea sp. (in: a-proteobacteria)]